MNDELHAVSMSDLCEFRYVLDVSKEVRLLHNYRSRIRVRAEPQEISLRAPILIPPRDDRHHTEASRLRDEDPFVVWIDRTREQDLITFRCAGGEVHRLGERAPPVVEPGVRDIEPGQLADHRLVLEQRLKDALRELGLVRRV